MRIVSLVLGAALLAGAGWWAFQPSSWVRDIDEAYIERDLWQLRAQFPTLTEDELRQKLAEER